MVEGAKEVLSKLIDSVPVLLIVLGVLLVGLGLAGGITYNQWFPIPELAARIASVAVGGTILGLGVFNWRTRASIPNARNFGVKIEYPRNGDVVDIVDVRGRIKKALPEGYTLKIFRIYVGSESYIPVAEAKTKAEEGTWEAGPCNIGGKTGDRRAIGAYLVGPGGSVLLDYYARAVRVHKATRDELRQLTGKEAEYLPSIDRRTPDMIECDRVSVVRK